jgi:hypothetical protein
VATDEFDCTLRIGCFEPTIISYYTHYGATRVQHRHTHTLFCRRLASGCAGGGGAVLSEKIPAQCHICGGQAVDFYAWKQGTWLTGDVPGNWNHYEWIARTYKHLTHSFPFLSFFFDPIRDRCAYFLMGGLCVK